MGSGVQHREGGERWRKGTVVHDNDGVLAAE